MTLSKKVSRTVRAINRPSLSFIIVDYNRPDLVRTLLLSLDRYLFAMYQPQPIVYVVDNGSANTEDQQLLHDFPWILLLRSEKNIGFGAGNNLALKEVTTDYVMLLNSDTELFATHHLERLVEYMEAHPKCGIATPKVLLDTGDVDMACHRGEPTPWAAFCYFMKLATVFPQQKLFAGYHQTYLSLEEVHSVDACSGAAMLIRTSALKQVGFFDERFFMYAEDLDLCRRFREAGYTIAYYPLSEVRHHKYQSGQKHNSVKTSQKARLYFFQTMLQYYDKYYRTGSARIIRWLIVLYIHIRVGQNTATTTEHKE